MKFKPIKDYYLIGGLYSAALVSKDASIDWLCLPNFDSPSIFAKILDEKAGSFSLKMNDYKIKSNYLDETAIVEYNIESGNLKFTLRDFMLPSPEEDKKNHFLVRKISALKGSGEVTFVFNPKPDYARSKPEFQTKDNKLILSIENDRIELIIPENSEIKELNDGYEIKIDIKESESKSLIIEYILDDEESIFNERDLENETIGFWKNWISRGRFFDFHRNDVVRSLITLKMMQFYHTGAMIAAPTNSLPDEIGGIRNWDYRYVWVRDAAFTLYAFYITDYVDEAIKFFKFIKKAASDNKENEFELNVVYSIWGKSAPDETELDNLSGYKNSNPVKVGNNATNQFQLDIYGNLIDAHYFISKREKDNVTVDKKLIKTLLVKIEENWMTKDSGIWEMRGNKYHYTYSKVMCWVGVDRALRMKDELSLSDKEIDKLKKLRKEIKDWIWKNCYDEEQQNFVQYKDSKDIDATNLLFVLLQFLDKDDSKTKTIIDNTVKVLCKNEVFVYRYLADDGLKGKDNAFILCSYWMISAYAIIGETDKAKDLFKKLNKHFDKSGLISEQMNQDNFEYLGNFPQAFSHLGNLMSAYYINRYSN